MIYLSKPEDSKASNDFQTSKNKAGKPCGKRALLRYNELPTLSERIHRWLIFCTIIFL